MAQARYWLQHLCDLLYAKDDLEEAAVECALEELAYALGRDIPATEIQIMRKREKKICIKFDPIADWTAMNNQYLKTL